MASELELIIRSIQFLFFGFAIVVLVKILSGRISVSGLLRGTPGGTPMLQRLQLLLVAVATPAAVFLSSGEPDSTRLTVAPEWLIALGGSQAIYFAGKSAPGIWDRIPMLRGPRGDAVSRRHASRAVHQQ